MVQVSFYILSSESEKMRIALVRRILVKAYQQNQQVLVYFDDEVLMHRVDQHLWSVPPESFLPHAVINSGVSEPTIDPILLSMIEPENYPKQILLNFSQKFPVFCEKYQRIIEVLPQQDYALALGRERYRAYRQLGFTLETHNL